MTYKEWLDGAKKIKIEKNFTLYEIGYSETALKNGVNNIPSFTIINNAKSLIKNVLQPTRNHFNKPLIVNCIYRSPELNIIIKGSSKTSQHLKGEACDFFISGVKLINIYNYIKNNLTFDELILEDGWIHVSFSNKKNKKEAFYSI